MKNLIAGTLTAMTVASFATAAAMAEPASTDVAKADPKPVVVERNAQGKATKVRIGEYIVDVCMDESMTDGCINPREAGLNWGNRPTATYRPDAD